MSSATPSKSEGAVALQEEVRVKFTAPDDFDWKGCGEAARVDAGRFLDVPPRSIVARGNALKYTSTTSFAKGTMTRTTVGLAGYEFSVVFERKDAQSKHGKTVSQSEDERGGGKLKEREVSMHFRRAKYSIAHAREQSDRQQVRVGSFLEAEPDLFPRKLAKMEQEEIVSLEKFKSNPTDEMVSNVPMATEHQTRLDEHACAVGDDTENDVLARLTPPQQSSTETVTRSLDDLKIAPAEPAKIEEITEEDSSKVGPETTRLLPEELTREEEDDEEVVPREPADWADESEDEEMFVEKKPIVMSPAEVPRRLQKLPALLPSRVLGVPAPINDAADLDAAIWGDSDEEIIAPPRHVLSSESSEDSEEDEERRAARVTRRSRFPPLERMPVSYVEHERTIHNLCVFMRRSERYAEKLRRLEKDMDDLRKFVWQVNGVALKKGVHGASDALYSEAGGQS